MANIGTLLKDEITRLGRRVVRQQVDPVKKASAAHRRDIAALKRQVVALQRQVATLVRLRARETEKWHVESAMVEDVPFRFVAKGLVTLRARLGLSAADLAKLLGVSGQSVYNWEAKRSVPRKEQLAAIAALRPLGKRAVHAKLEHLSASPKRKGQHRKGKSK